MMCHIFLLFVNVWMVTGDHVGFNDSLDAVPPLFALQDWARCRRPGDAYCVLEAALVAGNQSTMELIQEYSSKSLQHFNRSLVHRGVCASRCGAGDAAGAGGEGGEAAGAGGEGGEAPARAQRCVADELRAYGFEARFEGLRSLCESPGRRHAAGSARALAALAAALAALAVAATAAHALTERFGKDCSKFVLAFSLRQNWNILTYDRSKPRSDHRMKGVACMEGIRVLGMQCVIFAHVLLVTGTSFIENPHFLEHFYESFMGQAVMNSPVWLQAFFCISGFLTAYTTLVGVEASPFTPLKAAVAMANRWMRLTPIAGIMLWFTASTLPRLGAGPLWGWAVGAEAEACAERWWYHLLYVHNYLPLNKMCMGHTWYLAVDMQLHLLGMVLLLVLVRCRRAALPVLAALLAGSAAAAGLTTYWHQLTPIITAQSPEDLRTLFSRSKILPHLYLPMWTNLAGYAGGMGAAFLLYQLQSQGIKLKETKWFNVMFHLALPLGTCVVLAGTTFLRGSPAPWAAALYAALDRPLVALCFSVFMLGCIAQCKSHLRSMFAWRGFHTLGRLSYCVFLVHFGILRLLVTGNPQLGHPTALSLMSLLITASVLSHIIAIPLCLLVELPAISLFKALTEKERPPVALAPLDLVVTRKPDLNIRPLP